MTMVTKGRSFPNEDSETDFTSLLRCGFAAFLNLLRSVRTHGYPEEPASASPRYRGIPRLTVDESGELECVSCFLCETVCPAQCISIRTVNSTAVEATQFAKGRWPEQFDIDIGRCLFCGLCAEACPEEALVMDGRQNLSGETRGQLIFDKERLRLPVAVQKT